MADDPRRGALAQWRHGPETAAISSDTPTQLRTRRASPSHHQQQPPPRTYPPSAAHEATTLPVTAPRSYPQSSAQPHSTNQIVGGQHQHYVLESGRTRPLANGFADNDRKGAENNANQNAIPRKGPSPNHYSNPQRLPPPPARPQHTESFSTAAAAAAPRPRGTSERDAYQRQREKQRDLEIHFARMMDAHRGSSVGTHTSYHELVSPARPLAMENGGAFAMGHHHHRVDHDGVDRANNADAYGRAPRSGRRVAPSEVMQELDDDFRRSFGEHQLPVDGAVNDPHSIESAQDEGEDGEDEDDGDAFGVHANGNGERDAPMVPPGVAVQVRVQHPLPPMAPFREEISSDLSSDPYTPHAAEPQSPPSMDDSTRAPTSDDIGAFDYIPSISMTPPASPSHRHDQSSNASAEPQQRDDPEAVAADPRRSAKASERVVFSTWSIGFLAGCVVVGLGGLFLEELMQIAGLFLQTSPFTLSRLEQREMSRRLDLLQQELHSFRAAASEIEQQSQRMVDEVRAHLARMKTERERHQQMISKEMDALRKYVQAVTNELVEDEKKEIRKRLLETIADTIVELPDDLEVEPATQPPPIQSAISIDKDEHAPTVDVVDIAFSVAEGKAASVFEGVDEADVMLEIHEAVAAVPAAVREQVLPATSENTASVDATTSLFSIELVLLLAGVALIAGVVGLRVRKAHRRKNVFLHRKPAGFLHRFGAKTQPATAMTDESDVETVAFFRGDSDGEASFSRFSTQSEDDIGSEYSEEQKEGDAGDEYYNDSQGADDESTSLASSGADFEYQRAETRGDLSTHSDVESLDESRSSSLDGYPPTPYPRMQQKLKDRLMDESPSTRRSPRTQRRSNLSAMR